MLSMLARLGIVLYWLGCLLAAGLLLLAGALFWNNENYRAVVFLAALGVVCGLIGRACKYVLAARHGHKNLTTTSHHRQTGTDVAPTRVNWRGLCNRY
jgi:drug/metabolite transporter (DMT)-like permease